ncbi:MAG: hypothetical protein WCH43_14080, partial [Verrucomicrobiota bacterium]
EQALSDATAALAASQAREQVAANDYAKFQASIMAAFPKSEQVIPAALASRIASEAPTQVGVPSGAIKRQIRTLAWRIEDLSEAIAGIDRVLNPPAKEVAPRTKPPRGIPQAAIDTDTIQFKGASL